MNKIIDILINKWFLIIASLWTLAFGVITAINQDPPISGVLFWTMLAFLIGICIVIIQLIVFNYQIHSRINIINDIKEHIKKGGNIKPYTEFTNIKEEINKKIDNNEVDSITIICYGTSGFGNLIQDLNTKKSQIKVDILLCSPNSKQILYKEDKTKINEVIQICSCNDKITVTKSLIPPTIRACILYGKNKNPIWASIQTYFFEDNKQFNSFNYQKFYAVVADEDKSHKLLKEMETIIKDEFERLFKFSLKEQNLNDKQINIASHCRKNKKITKQQCKKITSCSSNCKNTTNCDLTVLVTNNILKANDATNYILAE